MPIFSRKVISEELALKPLIEYILANIPFVRLPETCGPFLGNSI
jgi:hypothetical protein